ncbi:MULTISPECIES: hypothetical protein [Candidatus Ichthyocystis]|uniref:Putative membrane protein n=1 Tax=Candidatus Ichthyocystis hellenicum TaxID=1561003 RepID=A0A0S4M7X4_9BURK|nr:MULTISPECIES: hypothetical protein [Ichthyocystis]CUT18390.1 putative membrane protein [Candidatus Ichthyocystis hellenicum]
MFNTGKLSTGSRSVSGSLYQCDAVDSGVGLFANSVSSSRRIFFYLRNFIAPLLIFEMIGYVTGGCKSESSMFAEEWEGLKKSICRLINDTREEDLIGLLDNSSGHFPLVFPGGDHDGLNLTGFIDVFFNTSLMIYSVINYTDTDDSPCYDHSHQSCANITKYMLEPPVEFADRGPVGLVLLFVGFIVLCLVFGISVVSSYSVRNSRFNRRNMVV